jgi:hypothetical protein
MLTRTFLRSMMLVAGSAGLAAACGTKGESTTATTATATTGNATGTGGTTSATGAGGATATGTGGATTSTSASTTMASSSSAASSSGMTSSSASSSSTAASSSSTGMMLLNGCDPNKAMDKTNNKLVSISGIQPWQLVHQVCVKVTMGTQVSWTGDFTFHPIAGGATGMTDAQSPITIEGAKVNGQGAKTLNVVLTKPGAYPYYCTVHLSSMQGVVYVMP